METKPGLKTTEFWLNIALQVLFLLNTTQAWTYMPPKYSALAQAILGGAYMLSRGQAKAGIPANAAAFEATQTWDTDAANKTGP